MDNKIVVITGATSGVGKETARALAAMGATIAILGRDVDKGHATLAELRPSAKYPDRLSFLSCDLSKLADVRSAAGTLHERFDHIDVLVNNAGVINVKRRETVDGYEETFAVNHLAHFLLTGLLLDLLLKAPQGRVIVVSSNAHLVGRINRDDPQRRRFYRGFRQYAASKLANLYFTFELARRLEDTPVTVNALHPGAVASNFSRNNGVMATLAMRVLKPFFITSAEGAKTSVFLAASPKLSSVTGRYFYRSRQHATSRLAQDRDTAKWLWQASETLTGFTYPDTN
jgi:NAD(P)-dependent dehydrogenase (short-subunit alcohol dehydrogenase family)